MTPHSQGEQMNWEGNEYQREGERRGRSINMRRCQCVRRCVGYPVFVGRRCFKTQSHFVPAPLNPCPLAPTPPPPLFPADTDLGRAAAAALQLNVPEFLIRCDAILQIYCTIHRSATATRLSGHMSLEAHPLKCSTHSLWCHDSGKWTVSWMLHSKEVLENTFLWCQTMFLHVSRNLMQCEISLP